jgi:hypothetical protein
MDEIIVTRAEREREIAEQSRERRRTRASQAGNGGTTGEVVGVETRPGG